MTKRITALFAGAFALLASAGSVQAQTSASPYTSATRYDLMGRVTGTIAPDPDGPEPTGALRHAATRNTYDAAGRLTKVETGELAAWQPHDVAPLSWSGFSVHTKVETTYNAQNAKLTERLYGWNGTAFVDISLTQYSYDTSGRLLCTAVRMNTAVYSGTLPNACALGTEGSHGPDRITKNIYDIAGQLVQVRKGVGTSLEQAYVTYSYTDNGKQASVTDANGNRAEMVYDGFDRQVVWRFPSKTTPGQVAPCTIGTISEVSGITGPSNAYSLGDDCEKYWHDRNGNRAKLAKRDGSILTYQYDFLNRMIRKAVPERTGLASTHTRDVFYSYDLRGLQTEARFDSASGEGVTNAWNGFGRQDSATVNLDAQSRQLSYLYDKNGNRIRITHPDTTWFTYGYDGLNRLNLLQRATTTLLTPSYNNRGLLSGVDRIQSALDQSFGYDSASRVSSIGFSLGSDSANVSWSFTRNAASQFRTEDRTNDSYAWAGQVNTDLNYTANGLNQYAAAGTETFCYDANGNLSRDDQYAYLYDVENRLVEMRVKVAGACPTASSGYTGYLRAQLRYDPLGRLHEVKSYTGANVLVSTRRFLHDGDAMVLEYDGGTAIVNRYVHGSDAKADDPLIWYAGSGVTETAARHLYADPRGSIVLVKQSSGATIALNSYDEWGRPEDPTASGTATRGRFRFTGQVWLDELGMYYYKARIYSPRLGRFMQTDPIGYEDQLNLYAYVGNDPVNGTDPTGTEACCYDESGYHLPELDTPSSPEEAGGLLGTIVGVVITVLDGPPGDEPAGAAAGAAAGRAVGRAFSGGERAATRGSAGGPRAGKSFTPGGKREIDRRNADSNGGANRCESCGRETPPAQQSRRGESPPGNQRERDHVIPRSQGGDGAPENGQVLCRDCNQAKSDRMPEQ